MPIMRQRQRIADFFGLKKHIVALLAMVILVGLGEKMAERFLPLYLMVLGGGAFSNDALYAWCRLQVAKTKISQKAP